MTFIFQCAECAKEKQKWVFSSGKYEGKDITEVPVEYLQRRLARPGLNSDMRWNIVTRLLDEGIRPIFGKHNLFL